MKVFIVLAVCVAAVSAGKTHYAAVRGPVAFAGPVAAAAAPVSTGTSSQFRQEDNYGNYNFGYDESHATGSTSRREESINGVQRGSYSLTDADGRQRLVTYIADNDGFRAHVQTNEPGVEPKDSADVLVNKGGAIAAPAVAVPAPLPVQAPLPAPVFEAPAPLPAPLPVAAPAPVKGYFAQRVAAPIVQAPVAVAPAAPIAVEPETPRAFSYSFGSSHLAAPVLAQAPLPAAPAVFAAPLPAPAAPIFQQQLEY